MNEPTTYLGASSVHLHCENYTFRPNTSLRIFKRDEICTQLSWIDIKDCNGILDSTTFKNLPNLEIISFDKCNIEKIEENTFSTLANLRSINVRKSVFALDQNTFKNCEKIDNIRFIQIATNDSSLLSFAGLNCLEYLMIDRTNGLKLCKDMFIGLANLKYLFIQNCEITSALSEDAFEPLIGLETFYFTGNTLGQQFNPKAFLSLKDLIIFGLYDNTCLEGHSPIIIIDYQIFENLPNLKTINFPEESIRALNFGGFKKLKNVQLVIGKTTEDISDFLEKKNITIQWTTDSDLTEDVDFSDPNIQICA